MATMDTRDVDLIGSIQTTIPVVERPFAELGARLGMGEAEVLTRMQRLKDDKLIRQISAIFDTRSLGYATSLVAAKVRPELVDAAAAIISRHPGVSHNYLRNHPFNLWYTLAVSPLSRLGLAETVNILHRESGADSTRMLPTLKLFKIGVNFDLRGEPATDDTEAPVYTEPDRPQSPSGLSPIEVEFVRVMQQDLPLTATPFVDYARHLGMTLPMLQTMHEQFLATGRMRRFAAVLYHRKAGFNANAMGVWAVDGDDARIDEIGGQMAAFRAVSHCYRRPTYPDWPYNIFTMIHAKSQADSEAILRAMAQKTGIAQFNALYSATEYKKTRVRYFTDEQLQWEQSFSSSPD